MRAKKREDKQIDSKDAFLCAKRKKKTENATLSETFFASFFSVISKPSAASLRRIEDEDAAGNGEREKKAEEANKKDNQSS